MNPPSHTRRRSHQRCRGSVYVIVLASAMLLVTIGVGSILATRVAHRSAKLNLDIVQARQVARSGIELAAYYFRLDPNWRTGLTSGVIVTGYPMAGGTVDLSITDPVDGNLANDPDQEVFVLATGYSGSARAKLGVRMKPNVPQGLTCLASAAHAGGNISVGLLDSVSASAPVSTNGNFTNTLTAAVNAPVEAAGSITNLGSISGYTTAGAVAKDMPDSAAVIAYYSSIATTISYSSLASGGGGRRLEKVLLSPGVNPYGSGTKNALGVYKIDCGGGFLEVRNCRIFGTLLIISPGSGSVVSNGTVWQTARADMPAMVVSGNFTFSASGTVSESSIGVNLNPSHTPYNGGSDSSQNDTYSTIIEGLCYLTGSATFSDATPFKGAIVAGGTMTFGSSTTITHDSSLFTSPPVGFAAPTRYMIFVPNSWQRYVD